MRSGTLGVEHFSAFTNNLSENKTDVMNMLLPGLRKNLNVIHKKKKKTY